MVDNATDTPAGTRLYVGNLPYSTTEEELSALFAEFGEVNSIRIINDRETGRSKGFAFVELADKAQAEAAIAALNGKDFDGRALVVSEARPLAPRDNNRSNDGGDRGRNFSNFRTRSW